MILAIETSDVLCSVAFYENGTTLIEYNLEAPMQHATLVAELVEKGLQFLKSENRQRQLTIDDIHLCAAGLGPGSFTGLRIGLSYLQGFCLGKQIPFVGVSNLQVLAMQKTNGVNEVYTVIDARRNELYFSKINIISNVYPQLGALKIVSQNDLETLIPEGAHLVCNRRLKLNETILKSLKNKKIIVNSNAVYNASILAQIADEKLKFEGADSIAETDPLYIRPFAGAT
jgi:tRNA threonylcarbamoyladenosine biosynthesis protein TsaB